MRILMLAPPGAGKGTQATRLAEKYDIEHLSSGEILRAEVEAGTALGDQVREAVDQGDLVPDDVILRLVSSRLVTAATNGGYVLDGFPRTLAQAHAIFDQVLANPGWQLERVIHLEVPRDELHRRRQARAEAEGRADDTATVFEHRLDVYDRQTAPLIDYYRGRGLLIAIDGSGTPDEVAEQIFAAVDDLAPL